MTNPAEATDGMNVMEAFAALPFGDMWEDARLADAVVYARGARSLKIPEAWRGFLPTTL